MESTSILQLALGGGLALSAAAAVGSYATFVPGNRIWGPVVWRGTQAGPPGVALTFDDGPTAGATDRVLDVLAELNVQAAFFLIGRNVEREPDLARRIVAEGHIVGNHTYDHSHWSAMGRPRFWNRQLSKTDQAIESATGKRPLLFRPPIGHKTPHTMAAAKRRGQAVVTWSIRGWDGVPTTAGKIVAHVVPRCRSGSIIVLHDGVEPGRPRDPSATINAIKPLVREIRAKGLQTTRLDHFTGLRPYA